MIRDRLARWAERAAEKWDAVSWGTGERTRRAGWWLADFARALLHAVGESRPVQAVSRAWGAASWGVRSRFAALADWLGQRDFLPWNTLYRARQAGARLGERLRDDASVSAKVAWGANQAGWGIAAWFGGRNWRHLFFGLPVLGVAVLAVLLARGIADDQDELPDQYQRTAAGCFRAGDFVGAKTCYERLAQMGIEDGETRFRFALSLLELNEKARAEVILRKLAPTDAVGYGPAHYYLARHLLSSAALTPAQAAEVERHLLIACDARDPPREDRPAPGRLAELERFKQFTPAHLTRIEANTLLGKRYVAEGKLDRAEAHLRRAAAEAVPDDSIDQLAILAPLPAAAGEAHKLLGQIYMSRGKLDAAELFLLKARSRTRKDDPGWVEIQTMLGRAYFLSDLHLEAEPCLQEAILAPLPEQPATVEALSLLGQMRLRDGRDDEAETLLLRAAASKFADLPAVIAAHANLGQLYLKRRGYADAEKHLTEVLRAKQAAAPVVVAARTLLARLCFATDRPRDAETHLTQALAVNLPDLPATAEARAMLGQHYEQTGRASEAINLLEKASEEQPGVGLALARLLLAHGKRQQAEAPLRRAKRYFQQQAEANLLRQDAHHSWVECAVLLGEHAAALDALHKTTQALQLLPGLTGQRHDYGIGAVLVERAWVAPQSARYAQTLAAVSLQWLTILDQTPNSSPSQRFTLLDLATRADPGNAALLGRLLAVVRPRPAEADSNRDFLKALLADNRAPVLSRLGLALDGLRRGDATTDPGRLLQEALAQAPQTAQAMNNVAFLLALRAPEDAPRALALIDAVLARWPDQPNYRDTRGQILMRLGRWQEACLDLEAALPRMTNKKSTHQALAEAYQHLGQTEKAAQHRRLAETKVQ